MSEAISKKHTHFSHFVDRVTILTPNKTQRKNLNILFALSISKENWSNYRTTTRQLNKERFASYFKALNYLRMASTPFPQIKVVWRFFIPRPPWNLYVVNGWYVRSELISSHICFFRITTYLVRDYIRWNNSIIFPGLRIHVSNSGVLWRFPALINDPGIRTEFEEWWLRSLTSRFEKNFRIKVCMLHV